MLKSKTNRRSIVVVILVFNIAFFLLFLSHGFSAQCNPMTLKACSFGSQNYSQRLIFEKAITMIEDKTNGGLKFDYYPGSSLMKLTQTFNAMKNNIIQVAITFDGYERGRMGILSSSSILPFTWDIDKWHNRWREPGSYYDFAEPFWNKYNMHLLAVPRVYAGALHATEPIHELQDFDGKLIRVAPGLAPAVEALGAEPVFISLSELYSALQKGVVDGGLSSMSNYVGTKRYEVAPYLTICNFYSGTLQHAMNLETYNSLCPKWQKIFDDSFREAEQWWASEVHKVFEEQIQTVINGGGKVYHVPDEELKKWKEASEPFWDQLKDEYPQDYPRLMEIIKKIDG